MNSLLTAIRGKQWPPVVIVSIGVLIACGAYLQALNFPFISDDSFYLSGNTKLAGLRFTELWRLLIEPYNPYEFLPLRDFSYWLDLSLFGLTPAAFRLHNLLLYVVCCVLVYATTLSLWRYFKPDTAASAPWAAATVAALFTLHPAHVEAVVWISGRKDLLSGMFVLLAIWFAVKARREQGLVPGYAVAALLALLAAMLSKATSVAAAPVVALLWIVFWRDIPFTFRRRSMLLWPLAALLLAACVAPIFMGYSTVKLPAYFGVEAYTRALAILGWMVRLAISPFGRHYIYPVFEDAWFRAMVALGAAVLLGAIAGMALLLRKRSLAGFALLAFALLSVPYLQFSSYITHSLVTDRFLFLAVWPLLLLLVALLWRLSVIPRVAIFLLVVLPWIFHTVERPRDWRNYEALMDVELEAYPGYYAPLFQAVEKYLSQGQYREARQAAERVADPEIRNIIVRLVDGAYAVAVEAVQTGDPRNAMAKLQAVAPILKQPLEQARWNTPMFSFWLSSSDLLMLEWKTLARNFPADESVGREAKLHLGTGS
ncbi:MAG: hypothetical protein WA435_04425 [Gallionellaceae bacterium]